MKGCVRCPYCNVIIPDSPATKAVRTPSFSCDRIPLPCPGRVSGTPDSTIEISFYLCPACDNYVIFAEGVGSKVKHLPFTTVLPQSSAIHFPEYIPEGIRRDYEEACDVLNYSPKSAATLARRCLQGMIADFWKIKCDRLVDAVNALEEKIPAGQWKAVNGLRRIGNIGAHMEKDVNVIIDIDPGEAEKLIQLIEILMKQWYMDRYEQERLYESIQTIDAEKQELRK